MFFSFFGGFGQPWSDHRPPGMRGTLRACLGATCSTRCTLFEAVWARAFVLPRTKNAEDINPSLLRFEFVSFNPLIPQFFNSFVLFVCRLSPEDDLQDPPPWRVMPEADPPWRRGAPCGQLTDPTRSGLFFLNVILFYIPFLLLLSL